MTDNVAARIAEMLNRNADEAADELLGIQSSNQRADLEHRVGLSMADLLKAKSLVEAAKPQLFVELHENPILVVVHHRRRTWRERLLARPWRPWRRAERTYLPDPHIYKFPGPRAPGGRQVEYWVAHPATAARVREVAREHGVEL